MTQHNHNIRYCSQCKHSQYILTNGQTMLECDARTEGRRQRIMHPSDAYNGDARRCEYYLAECREEAMKSSHSLAEAKYRAKRAGFLD